MAQVWNVIVTIFAWLSIPLFVFSVWLLIRSISKDRRIRVITLVLPLVTTLLVPIVYVLFTSLDPPRFLSAVLFLTGLAVGALWANTTTLTLREGFVFGRRSYWYLVIWGGTFVLTQLLSLLGTPAMAAWGLSTMYLSMGLSIGTNVNLLYRRAQVAQGKPDQPLGPGLGKKAADAPPA